MPRGSFARGFSAIAPGILIAATGVGAGDLLTAGLAGAKVGTVILWAAVAGALLKWFLNEGLARWQMATGTTLLEGWCDRLGSWTRWVFLIYLIPWSFFTCGAIIFACGVAGDALLPIAKDTVISRSIWGCLHSLAGVVLVMVGGFRLFEKLMSVCIAVMFVAVIATALLIRPDWNDIGLGLVVPTIPSGRDGLGWVLGVLGGVGGTLTVLSYGYWIREEGREGSAGVRACRLDLAIGYAMTALFGMAMIIIGSRLRLEGGGVANMAVALSQQLQGAIGPGGKWLFLIGFWGAVFSSLLGVWQGVPYLFADFLQLRKRQAGESPPRTDFTRTKAYRAYLLAMATIPMVLLTLKLAKVQLIYGVFGSLFMPFLALTLLLMNNRLQWVGRGYRNGWVTNLALAVTLLFFIVAGACEISERLLGK
jgi:Mn2+/Fe2+ NRAMP family transporter